MKKVLLIATLSILSITSKAVYTAYDLEHIDSLINSLKVYHIKKYNSEINSYLYSEKYKFLKYVPSFGWNFMSNTPFIGYNTSELFNMLNLKRKQKAEIESIKLKCELEFNNDVIELKTLIRNYNIKLQYFYDSKLLFDAERELFEITIQKYKNHEATPSEYLTKHIHFENVDLQRLKLETEIFEMKNLILLKAKKTEYISLF